MGSSALNSIKMIPNYDQVASHVAGPLGGHVDALEKHQAASRHSYHDWPRTKNFPEYDPLKPPQRGKMQTKCPQKDLLNLPKRQNIYKNVPKGPSGFFSGLPSSGGSLGSASWAVAPCSRRGSSKTLEQRRGCLNTLEQRRVLKKRVFEKPSQKKRVLTESS